MYRPFLFTCEELRLSIDEVKDPIKYPLDHGYCVILNFAGQLNLFLFCIAQGRCMIDPVLSGWRIPLGEMGEFLEIGHKDYWMSRLGNPLN